MAGSILGRPSCFAARPRASIGRSPGLVQLKQEHFCEGFGAERALLDLYRSWPIRCGDVIIRWLTSKRPDTRLPSASWKLIFSLIVSSPHRA
jgi:hypothetical protein